MGHLENKLEWCIKKAKKEGKGVVLVGGKLVEALDVENAKRLLSLAEKIRG